VALMLFFGCITTLEAYEEQGGPSRESQLKAAYLVNFLKFVDWPATLGGVDLLVCVRGAAGVHDALKANSGKTTIGARSLAVRDLAGGESVNGCNALYIGSDARRLGALLTAEEAALPLLTVSDAEGFARREGIIELVTETNRLRFNINLNNARRAGLRLSAGLLQLAASVEGADYR
jgi:hypothetical protein